jgi:hypothetical protein
MPFAVCNLDLINQGACVNIETHIGKKQVFRAISKEEISFDFLAAISQPLV